MKFRHIYRFYMATGERLEINADDMTICDDFIKLHRDKDGNEIFMNIYKRDLMAWEVIR